MALIPDRWGELPPAPRSPTSRSWGRPSRRAPELSGADQGAGTWQPRSKRNRSERKVGSGKLGDHDEHLRLEHRIAPAVPIGHAVPGLGYAPASASAPSQRARGEGRPGAGLRNSCRREACRHAARRRGVTAAACRNLCPHATDRSGGPPPLCKSDRGDEERLTGGRLHLAELFRPIGFQRRLRRRARTTVWHHGQDIFAALGAPVLAVADGTSSPSGGTVSQGDGL